MALGPRIPSPEDQTRRLIDNATANAGDWLKNTLAPKKDPIDEAVKKKGKYERKVQEAIREDRYAKGLQATDRDAMRATIEATGTSGFADGIRRREAKILASRRALFDLQVSVVGELDKMPAETDDQAKAKMVRNFELQKALGKKYREVK